MRWLAASLFLAGLSGSVALQAQPVLDPDKAITQYLHDAWQIDDGLPQNTVETILQTRDGYLWLGTEEGLVRFNGYEFAVFDRSNTLAFQESQTIKALHEDASGALWIGTRGGGLVRRAGEAFTRYAADSLGDQIISALAEDASGTLWVGTFEAGLFACRGDSTCVPFEKQEALSSTLIRKLLVDRAGTLWVGTDKGLNRISGGTVQILDQEDGLAGEFVMALHEGPDGALWVSTRDGGLNRVAGRRVESFTPEEGWPEETIWSLWQGEGGALWLGLGRSGLVRYHEGRFDAFPPEDGLSHGRVLTLHSGREGSLWIGTEGGGLNRLRDAWFTTFTTQEGLSDNMALSVSEDAGGRVWVGTQGGGLNRLEGDSVTVYIAEDGLASDVVTSVYGTSDGSLWAGTLGAGLSRFKDGAFTTYTVEDGLPSASIFSLYEDSRKNLWLGTDAGLARFRNGEFTTYTTEDGLPSNFITALHEDASGRLWIGTYDAGLSRMRDGRFTAYAGADTLGSALVLALHEDADGALWIGTYGGGLTRLKDSTFTTFTIREGLFDDTVYQLFEDSRGRLWMGCNKGIFHVAKRELEAVAGGRLRRVTSTVYDRDDGLESREVNGGVQPAGWHSRDGRLWFPTVEGVAVVDPDRPRPSITPPPVVIEAVTFDSLSATGRAGLELKPGTERFEFQYAALTFIAPEEVRYRYRLKGYEERWSGPTARRMATYTHLDPGRYTFEVIAMNRDGVWSRAGASFSFYLKPFYYERPLFWLLLALGLVLLGFSVYRLRVRQLHAQQRHLERTVEERTEDLRVAKEQIEVQADELRASLGEKEVLLREIHHRVKNNLQVITSLLHLQSQKVEDRETLELFKECRDRIASMAMIHERLYQSDDLARVDLAAYLQNIADQLFRSYDVRTHQIDLEVNADAGLLNVDQAIPCGLIVNELVSNALKHAFPDGRRGRIIVSFEADAQRCRLLVKDSGVGLPAGFDVAKSRSLGLKLVQALTKKLRGTLRVCEEGDAVFEIVFPARRPPEAGGAPDTDLEPINRHPLPKHPAQR